jgi:hypothetical protein
VSVGVPGSLVGVVLNHVDVRGGIRVARMTRTGDMATMDAANACVPAPPASAAARASAVPRVIDEVHADQFLTDLAHRTVAGAGPDKHGELPSSRSWIVG